MEPTNRSAKGFCQGDRRSKHFLLDGRGPRQMTRQKVRHVWEGGLRGRGKYLATVRGLRHRNPQLKQFSVNGAHASSSSPSRQVAS
jgi:hypothetical protein